MLVTIGDTDYECRPLSPAARLQWNLYLLDQCERTFYSDLFATVEHLPAVIQQVVMAEHSPPARLDVSMPLYYKLATMPWAVRYLLEMVVEGDLPDVDADNAPGIFLALRQLIFSKPEPVLHDTEAKQQAAAEVFAAVEGATDGS